MYFPYRKAQSYDYAAFLLNEKFISKNVLDKVNTTISTKEVIEQREDFVEDEDDQQEAETGLIEVSKLPLKEIDDYISNLQTSARSWFDSFHPEHSPNLTKEEQEWLNRLNNVGINYFRPLVLSALITKKTKPEERVCLFKSIERFIFISFRLTQLRSNFGSSDAYYYSRELLKEKTTISQIVDFLEQRINYNFKDGNFNTIPLKNIIDGKFKHGSGFYSWGALRYVLFEYETYLSQRSKTATQKIQWTNFVNSNDTVTIEHIYPQTPTLPCWKIDFNKYSEKQRLILTNSIGNLLALSQPKNSSLQNKCFSDKLVNSDKTIGYFNGSYSENLVAEKYSEWTPVTIRDRGLEILSFIEKRWDISLGEVDEKLELLHVDFVK
jgi:hypothetical protein